MQTFLWGRKNTHISTSLPTTESWSMNGKGQVVWWGKICFLTTSAFLNNHSYLPPPQKEVIFPPFLLCTTISAPLISALPPANYFFSFINLLCAPLFPAPPFFFPSQQHRSALPIRYTLLLFVNTFPLCSLCALVCSPWNSPFSN